MDRINNRTLDDEDSRVVADVFDIDQDMLYTLAEDSDYWKNSFAFYEQVKRSKLAFLSERQINWLSNIQEQLWEKNK